MNDGLQISLLKSEDGKLYRQLRLQALRLHPEYYGASLEEEGALSADEFAQRLRQGAIFGAWLDEDLVGCAGLASREKTKLRHKANMWGMFIKPERRGVGIGKRLLEAVLAHARTRCEEVLLAVVEGNHEACGLYSRSGFEEYGREPGAIKIGTRYYDEILMRLSLTRS